MSAWTEALEQGAALGVSVRDVVAYLVQQASPSVVELTAATTLLTLLAVRGAKVKVAAADWAAGSEAPVGGVEVNVGASGPGGSGNVGSVWPRHGRSTASLAGSARATGRRAGAVDALTADPDAPMARASRARRRERKAASRASSDSGAACPEDVVTAHTLSLSLVTPGAWKSITRMEPALPRRGSPPCVGASVSAAFALSRAGSENGPW